jgi:hypothetical protein
LALRFIIGLILEPCLYSMLVFSIVAINKYHDINSDKRV